MFTLHLRQPADVCVREREVKRSWLRPVRPLRHRDCSFCLVPLEELSDVGGDGGSLQIEQLTLRAGVVADGAQGHPDRLLGGGDHEGEGALRPSRPLRHCHLVELEDNEMIRPDAQPVQVGIRP